jgi:hypothetical protein
LCKKFKLIFSLSLFFFLCFFILFAMGVNWHENGGGRCSDKSGSALDGEKTMMMIKKKELGVEIEFGHEKFN